MACFTYEELTAALERARAELMQAEAAGGNVIPLKGALLRAGFVREAHIRYCDECLAASNWRPDTFVA